MTQHWEIKIDEAYQRIDAQKTYIILQKVNRKPPHIGIIADGTYMSLSAKGFQKKAFDVQLELLNRSQTPCILFEMNFNGPEFNSAFTSECLQIKELNRETTCLLPIKKTLHHKYHLAEVMDAQYVFELLPMLKAFQLKTIALNLEVQNFLLPLYSMDEIQSCIEQYKND